MIDISKAVEGNFYEFTDCIKLDEGFLKLKDSLMIGECVVKGNYITESKQAHIIGESKLTFKAVCDNCLNEAIFSVTLSINETYATEGEFRFFNGITIDITDAVNEELYFKFPAKVLCNKDCKGLCPFCGINLNKKSCCCKADNQAVEDNNPFSALKDLNILSGGANNGSTKG